MLVSDMLTGVLAEAPECPDAEASRLVIEAAIELCEKSNAWNEVQESPILLVDTVHTYDVDVPDGAKLVAVMGVTLPARALTMANMARLSRELPSWPTSTSPEPLYFNSASAAGTFRVYPTPLNAGGLPMTIRASYAPLRSATEMDDDFASLYLDLITHGALSRLMAQPRKPWSNPQLAAFHGQKFEAGIVDATIAVMHDGSVGTTTATTNPFGF